MNRKLVEGLFESAGFDVLKTWKVENKYWPQHQDYDEIRKENPWWLVKTQYGIIELGRRKRVFSIDWEDTRVEYLISDKDVTRSDYMCHAWSTDKVLEYLKAISNEMKESKV